MKRSGRRWRLTVGDVDEICGEGFGDETGEDRLEDVSTERRQIVVLQIDDGAKCVIFCFIKSNKKWRNHPILISEWKSELIYENYAAKSWR